MTTKPEIQFSLTADKKDKTFYILTRELGYDRVLAAGVLTPKNTAWALRHIALRCLEKAFEFDTDGYFLSTPWNEEELDTQIEKLQAEAQEFFKDSE